MNSKREKTQNNYKIWLIYDFKLKSDVIAREISMKTQILTQNSVQNNPFDHRIKCFSFYDFEDKFRHSRSNFSLFSPRNITFKHSLDA